MLGEHLVRPAEQHVEGVARPHVLPSDVVGEVDQPHRDPLDVVGATGFPAAGFVNCGAFVQVLIGDMTVAESDVQREALVIEDLEAGVGKGRRLDCGDVADTSLSDEELLSALATRRHLAVASGTPSMSAHALWCCP